MESISMLVFSFSQTKLGLWAETNHDRISLLPETKEKPFANE